MKRRIVQAAGETTSEDRFKDAIDELNENFDFVVEGFEKLSRNGKEAENQALQLVLELSSAVEGITRKVADIISE